MTPEQAKQLKLHDKIQWVEDPADQGEIVYVTDECVAVKWHNDGVVGVYRFAGMALQFINLVEEKAGSNAHVS